MSDTPTDERGAPLAPMIRQLQERLAEAEAKISRLREDDEWMMRQLGKHSRKVNDLASALMEAADAIETDCGGRPDLRESTAQMYQAMANTTSEYMGWLRYGEDDE